MAVPMRKPSVEVRDERLVGRWIVGRAHEADPHVEFGRTHKFGVVEVHRPDDADLPRAPDLRISPASSGLDDDRGVSTCRITSASSALRSTNERVQIWSPWLIVTVLLATERPPCIRSTVMSQWGLGRCRPGEHGVDRLDRLSFLAGHACHYGLRKQLAAKDHVVLGGDIGRPVPIVTDRLQRQGAEERLNGEHRVSFS